VAWPREASRGCGDTERSLRFVRSTRGSQETTT
jgi:hypothetical protein